jgi:pyrimidine-nucleoside phosphorylase
MNFAATIATRRDRGRHTRDDLFALAQGAADGTIPDYQLSAWLMAAYLNPLGPDETAWLTEAMAASGRRLDLSPLPRPWVDKHSTGGVGDKTTLLLLPILAACGVTMVKMSGRGLGVTGGTIDKLESVPGFNVSLSPDELIAQAAEVGIALTGQSPDLAPADKVLYALRDVTGTTRSIPLLVSSILSKKVAGGAETIVLDVKAGSGAFMRTRVGALELAHALAQTAELLGLKCRLAVTDMDQPLGSAVGNALEVAEARAILRREPLGSASVRVRDLCVELAGIALAASGKADSESEGEARARAALDEGRAEAKARDWFRAQGADLDAELPVAPVVQALRAPSSGWLAGIDAETVGRVAIGLGAGRARKEDTIDPAVGVEVHGPVGRKVEAGEPLFTLHARSQADAEAAVARLIGAIEVSPAPVPVPPLVLQVL